MPPPYPKNEPDDLTAVVQAGLARRGALAILTAMSMNNVSVAEEALSLSPADRADLARLLIESLEGDRRTNAEIKAELAIRLAPLKSGDDPGLGFDEVFRDAS